jgi:hypothetical protein
MRRFLEEKQQKTSIIWTVPSKTPLTQRNKSFLVLFFKKEPLTFTQIHQP